MSTYLYLRCLDHNPPLVADGESGQHLYDLDVIRLDVADRVAVAAREPDYEYDSHFRRNTAIFLTAHQMCRIDVLDEYGRSYPLPGRLDVVDEYGRTYPWPGED
jgi:hypothetical protein